MPSSKAPAWPARFEQSSLSPSGGEGRVGGVEPETCFDCKYDRYSVHFYAHCVEEGSGHDPTYYHQGPSSAPRYARAAGEGFRQDGEHHTTRPPCAGAAAVGALREHHRDAGGAGRPRGDGSPTI